MSPTVAQRILNNEVEDRRPEARAQAVGPVRDAARRHLERAQDRPRHHAVPAQPAARVRLRIANALLRSSGSMPADARAMLREDARRCVPSSRRRRSAGYSPKRRRTSPSPDDARRSVEGAARAPGRLTQSARAPREAASGRSANAARVAVNRPDTFARLKRLMTDTRTSTNASRSHRSTTARSPTSAARWTRTCARSRPRSTSTIARRGARLHHRRAARSSRARRATRCERFYARRRAAAVASTTSSSAWSRSRTRPIPPADAAAGADGRAGCCARAAPTCTAARRTRSRT